MASHSQPLLQGYEWGDSLWPALASSPQTATLETWLFCLVIALHACYTSSSVISILKINYDCYSIAFSVSAFRIPKYSLFLPFLPFCSEKVVHTSLVSYQKCKMNGCQFCFLSPSSSLFLADALTQTCGEREKKSLSTFICYSNLFFLMQRELTSLVRILV